MQEKWKAHAALLSAQIIYGANYSIAKGIMPQYLPPFGFILLRVAGASLLFWLFGSLQGKVRIQRSDWPRLLLCSMVGVAGNQLCFFKGLSLTSPINAAIIMVCTPILVLVLALLFRREKLTPAKGIGVALGACGAWWLIASGSGQAAAGNPLGDFFILINALLWGLYLVLAKPLMQRYATLGLMKWIFLPGLLWVLPFGWTEFTEIRWSTFPLWVWGAVAYVVVGTTFLAYYLNNLAMRWVNPSVVSVYIYLQPLIATGIALWVGKYALTLNQVLATVLIFAGVYCVAHIKTERSS
jgi:drug/metabolite transporter (DMT)-like permease